MMIKTSLLSYWQLLRQHPRFACFGLLMAFYSSFGQTYFLGVFGHAIQQDMSLTHTQWGSIYMLGTLLSAMLIPLTGKWIDQTTLPKYTLAVILLLALACAFITQVHGFWWLVLGIFLLRQAGQGLMSHVAYTAMGRYFDHDRGKATALVAMGFAVGEAVLPVLAVLAIASVGWRVSLLLVGVWVLVKVLPLGLWLLRGHQMRHTNYEVQLDKVESGEQAQRPKAARRSWRRREVLGDYRFYLLVPGFCAPSVVSTAMFFHHLNLADEKGWSHTFMTGNYVLYSILVVVTAIITGQLVDRFSARLLMPYALLPMLGALLLLNLVDAYWIIWPYFILMGIGAGLSQTALAAIWPECYGVRYLGAIKSLFWTLVVLGSALGPIWLGSLVDIGYSFQQSVLSMAVFLLIASVLMVLGLRGFGYEGAGNKETGHEGIDQVSD